MSKFCCCPEPDLPDISLRFTCACCESRIEDHDEPDCNVTEAEKTKREEGLLLEDKYCIGDGIFCCCFRRKRHANSKRKKQGVPHDGSEA